MACRNGLTKRIKKAKNEEKATAKSDIRDEIDSLIEALWFSYPLPTAWDWTTRQGVRSNKKDVRKLNVADAW